MASKRAKSKQSLRGQQTSQAIPRLDSVTRRHASVLAEVWFNRGLSRSDLHLRSGTRLRTIGSLVEDLVSWGIIEEGRPRAVGVGRPQVPLSIAAEVRTILGVSMTAHRVILVKAGLSGSAVETPVELALKEGDDLVGAAAKLVCKHADERTLAIGVSVTGFVDMRVGEWLLSSAHPADERVSLTRLVQAAGRIPISIGNELHAMSAAARLAGRIPRGDSLLVHLEDGRIAASILVNGRPNRGSIMAANELGHTTMPVDISTCYCGQVGCIERIFSSEYLRSLGCRKRLDQALSHDVRSNKPALKIVDLLGRVVANAINFVRPERVILSSPYDSCTEFVSVFEECLERHALDVLYKRMTLEWQHFDPGQSAVAATALPLANILEEIEWGASR